MAQLISLATGISAPLVARHVVGRSRSCLLHIDRANVSGLHAELVWTGREWLLHDLASRNGTFIDGRRIAAGEHVALAAGMQISFGTSEPEYRLVDVSPPRLVAFGPAGPVIGDETLYLPSADDWDVVVMRDADGRWVVDTPEGPKPLEDEQCIVVRGQPYVVHLPRSVPMTRDAAAPLDDIALELIVSRDGEHVDVRVRHGDAVHTIESRAHLFLLLVLARARLADAQQGRLPEREHGWVHREDVMTALATDEAGNINLWVHRARQQFALIPIHRLAERIIERREGAGQLRLGLQNVTISDA